ncbi:MAG: MlaD family protein, partial [Rhizobacter sp.]
ADEILVQVFVQGPYDTLVTPDTRFWNASGVDLTVNASGLTLNTQTLASVISGGLAFERPAGATGLPAAPDGHVFALYPDRKAAMAPPDGPPLRVRMVFEQSVRGLSVGAPLDFLGIEIGYVRSIDLDFDRTSHRFPIEVTADIYPLRLGAARESLTRPGTDPARRDLILLQNLVEHGVRAQARSGNLITGQMYIALDFMPRTKRVVFDTKGEVPSIPTVPGTLSELQPQIAEIVDKINKVPFDEIGRNLNGTLQSANKAISQLSPEAQAALADVRKTLTEVQKTMGSAQTTLGNVDRHVLSPDAPLQRNAEQTMQDLQRAAQSLRTLTDYLERHPESLLRGKPDDAKLPSSR